MLAAIALVAVLLTLLLLPNGGSSLLWKRFLLKVVN